MMAKMGKGSSIIAVITLIIGLGVTGFIIYDNYIASAPTSPAENQWYENSVIVYYVQASEVWGTISAISIDFDVSAGQNVYFLFSGEINFDDSSNPNSYIEIQFEVDDIRRSQPSIYVRRYNIVSAHGLRISVSLQNYNATMTSGTHTITLVYRGDSTADSVRSCSLFVQTFNYLSIKIFKNSAFKLFYFFFNSL
ncbi:MAG: hypothetical protein ACFFG0_35505 [Candidatus Thorarchaeota archaeon]